MPVDCGRANRLRARDQIARYVRTILSCNRSPAPPRMRTVLNCNCCAMSRQPLSETPQEDHGTDAAPVVSSRDLLGNHRELVIRHGRERYRLLLTRSNKLILTK